MKKLKIEMSLECFDRFTKTIKRYSTKPTLFQMKFLGTEIVEEGDTVEIIFPFRRTIKITILSKKKMAEKFLKEKDKLDYEIEEDGFVSF